MAIVYYNYAFKMTIAKINKRVTVILLAAFLRQQIGLDPNNTYKSSESFRMDWAVFLYKIKKRLLEIYSNLQILNIFRDIKFKNYKLFKKK